MNTWKLTLEYEGTRYCGWQEQKNARAVAGEVRRAAEDFFSARVELVGAGRTDAGVHAAAQVAALRTNKQAGAAELLREINRRLPEDINILKAVKAGQGFDPIRDARARFYLYQISTRRTAFAKRFVWWVRDRLDIDLMSRASETLVGHHDFESFCEDRGDKRSTSVVIKHVELDAQGDLLLFRIGASHFLWKMVRRIVGSLVEVGRGSISPEEFASLLEPERRGGSEKSFHAAEHTAPPSGLFLEKVLYDGDEAIGPLAPLFPVRGS